MTDIIAAVMMNIIDNIHIRTRTEQRSITGRRVVLSMTRHKTGPIAPGLGSQGSWKKILLWIIMIDGRVMLPLAL